MDATFDSFGWQPRLVAAASAIAVAVIAYLAFLSHRPVGIVVVVVALCVTIGALIALVRTPMPSQVRTVLMLALIMSVLCLAMRAEFAFFRPLSQDLDRALAPGDSLYGNMSVRTPKPPRPVEVAISGLESDMPWASEARATIDGSVGDDIPGAGDWRISGEASHDREGTQMGLSISWRVSGLGSEADCGTLSVMAEQPRAAMSAVRDRFVRAIRKSVDRRHAECE